MKVGGFECTNTQPEEFVNRQPPTFDLSTLGVRDCSKFVNTNLNITFQTINSIRPYPGNPRKTEKAIEPVANSIREFGFRQPIVVDADGVIVVGHVRYQAAQSLGLTEVPVHVAADLTPEQARAFRIADNKTGEYAEWDYEQLEAELAALQESEFDMAGLSLTFEELESSLAEATQDTEPPNFAPVDAATQPRLDRKKPVTCPECGHAFVPA